MASVVGAEVDLTDVRLKYPGLAPWEIWLSEAQERMVLAVPPEKLTQLQELCDTYNVELTDIGAFTGSGRLVVRYDKRIVLDLSNQFLHEGIPQRQLTATIESREDRTEKSGLRTSSDPSPIDHSEILLKLLAHPNIASKASVIRIYDHEVQGGTVVKPLTGVQNDGPSDACVLKPLGAKGTTGIAIASGINAEYGKRDAFSMAMAVVDEAIRNAVAVGADPDRIAILDNFCWGDPLRPETLGSLVEACQGCREAALLFRTPFISGKDSLNNEYLGADGKRHAIPPTLLISSIGIVEDVTKAISMDLKANGNELYLVGDFKPVFGGSHFNLIKGNQGIVNGESVPQVSETSPKVYRAFHQAVLGRLVQSAHDLSEGGLAVAASEMCIAGRLGLEMDLKTATGSMDKNEVLRTLFGESTGCLLVEVKPENASEFEAGFAELPMTRIGLVSGEPALAIRTENNCLCSIPIPALVAAWNTPLQPSSPTL
jgi:phosphoribosylformylglycinamidine synthase